MFDGNNNIFMIHLSNLTEKKAKLAAEQPNVREPLPNPSSDGESRDNLAAFTPPAGDRCHESSSSDEESDQGRESDGVEEIPIEEQSVENQTAMGVGGQQPVVLVEVGTSFQV